MGWERGLLGWSAIDSLRPVDQQPENSLRPHGGLGQNGGLSHGDLPQIFQHFGSHDIQVVKAMVTFRGITTMAWDTSQTYHEMALKFWGFYERQRQDICWRGSGFLSSNVAVCWTSSTFMLFCHRKIIELHGGSGDHGDHNRIIMFQPDNIE